MQVQIRVQIVNPEHPHFLEHGQLTGEIVRLSGDTLLAKLKLDSCCHGVDSCFVGTKDIAAERKGLI
jgi:hypothetical protein